jgi:hypothetical protein
VTIASGLFRHRSSPSRSVWPPSSYQLRHLLQKGVPEIHALLQLGLDWRPNMAS